MVDGILPFRPRSEREKPAPAGDRMAELERMEELLELMQELGVETRSELQHRIEQLEASLEAESHGPIT